MRTLMLEELQNSFFIQEASEKNVWFGFCSFDILSSHNLWFSTEVKCSRRTHAGSGHDRNWGRSHLHHLNTSKNEYPQLWHQYLVNFFKV